MADHQPSFLSDNATDMFINSTLIDSVAEEQKIKNNEKRAVKSYLDTSILEDESIFSEIISKNDGLKGSTTPKLNSGLGLVTEQSARSLAVSDLDGSVEEINGNRHHQPYTAKEPTNDIVDEPEPEPEPEPESETETDLELPTKLIRKTLTYSDGARVVQEVKVTTYPDGSTKEEVMKETEITSPQTQQKTDTEKNPPGTEPGGAFYTQEVTTGCMCFAKTQRQFVYVENMSGKLFLMDGTEISRTKRLSPLKPGEIPPL